MTIFHNPKWPWALTGHYNNSEWFSATCHWDYYNIIFGLNILGLEVLLEIVHIDWHKKRWNKNGFGWTIYRMS